MGKKWVNILPVITILGTGCGNEKDSDKLEPPHELNRLTTGIFQAAKSNNYASAARQIEKLKVYYPHDIKLSKLHRLEMDNITIVQAQQQLEKDNLKDALQVIEAAIRQRGESLSLDAAKKELQSLIRLDEAVTAAASTRSAADLMFQLDLIDKLIKKHPGEISLSAGLTQRRRQQQDMVRREKQMTLIDLLSDIESAPAAKKPILEAQFEYENQRSRIRIPDKLLK